MEKKLYFELTSNVGLSLISHSLKDICSEIRNDIESDEDKNLQYTITPLYLTDKELEELNNQD